MAGLTNPGLGLRGGEAKEKPTQFWISFQRLCKAAGPERPQDFGNLAVEALQKAGLWGRWRQALAVLLPPLLTFSS